MVHCPFLSVFTAVLVLFLGCRLRLVSGHMPLSTEGHEKGTYQEHSLLGHHENTKENDLFTFEYIILYFII